MRRPLLLLLTLLAGCPGGGDDLGPGHLGGVEQRKSAPQQVFDHHRRRDGVLDRGVEATEQCAVEQPGMVGRGEHQAVGLVLLQELQERVEHAADLADIVARCTLGTEGVELVEQVHGARLSNCVEHQP
jgi:hypothetical protein